MSQMSPTVLVGDPHRRIVAFVFSPISLSTPKSFQGLTITFWVCVSLNKEMSLQEPVTAAPAPFALGKF